MPVEVYPIVAVSVLAVGGATWYLTRLARSPDVIWDKKNNPTPWNNVEPGTQYKLWNITGDFDKKYKRDRL
ncbi:hypothetical protein MARU1_001975 [Malassezia arunalokei]|uniref:NADH dehydrogenase [ubiquinone] 1 alpha subcomplex subunit 4 n=1 Tax=Malassezia arunalokei TaxID=1514897 RepID=A0AAJ5YZV9_9BASI|nr:hypothetical protein MARU1_001975 [Malassezia arunalokei]